MIPVAPGRMRNLLYPRQKAAYVTGAQLRELKNSNIVIERDFSFGLERPDDEHTSEESLVDVQAQPLSVSSSPGMLPHLHGC